MKRPAILLALALALLFAAMSLKPRLVPLPALPAPAAVGGFDAGRALARLSRILGDERPHPVDSPANDAVRARLVAELGALGLAPVVTDRLTCNGVARSRVVGCARIRNVRATIGPAGGRHILLASHYDSTPVGPGAADDGIGMATMLEIAALLKDRPLARPVTFLFDEGEELQLNGARAFLAGDPLAARIDAAINLEARGTTGPAIMFETSRPNAAAVALFARSAWHPVANSLTADFYRLIPNDTDVSVFAERGWTILNFAIIGNETRYHSPDDRIAALDPRSLAHMGVQALKATEQLAAAPPAASAANRVYAPLPGGPLADMPQALAVTIVLLLFGVAAGLALRRRSGRAVLALLAALASAAAAAWLLQRLAAFVRPGQFWRAHPEILSAAIDLTALAVGLGLLASLGRGIGRRRLRAGFWLLFMLVGAGLSLVLPGTSIFFLLPPLPFLIGVATAARWRGSEGVGALAAWLLLFLSWAPLLQLSEVLLDFGAGWMFASVAALVLLPALVELEPLAAAVPRPALLGSCAALAAAGWAASLALPAYSAERKQPFVVEYVREPKQARWMIVNDGAPPGLSGFEPGARVPWSSRGNPARWSAPAPVLPAPAPALERLGERGHPLGRVVRLRLRSGGSDSVILRGPPDAGFVALRAGDAVTRFGRGTGKDAYVLRCAGRSCDGLVVDLLLAGRRPVEALLIGFRYGLPAAARPLIAARPPLAAPHYTPDATASIVPVRF